MPVAQVPVTTVSNTMIVFGGTGDPHERINTFPTFDEGTFLAGTAIGHAFRVTLDTASMLPEKNAHVLLHYFVSTLANQARVDLYQNGTLFHSEVIVPSVISTWINHTIPLQPYLHGLASTLVYPIDVEVTHLTAAVAFLVSEVAIYTEDIVRSARIGIATLRSSQKPKVSVTKTGLSLLSPQQDPIRASKSGISILSTQPLAITEFLDSQAPIEPAINDGTRVSKSGITLLTNFSGLAFVEPLPLPAELNPLLINNWADEFNIVTRWPVNISKSKPGGEDRRCLADRPYRDFNLVYTSSDPESLMRFFTALSRHTQEQLPFPISPDLVRVNSPALIGENILLAEIAGRRFYQGAYIYVLLPGEKFNLPRQAFIAQIGLSDFVNGQVILTEPLSVNVPAGSCIVPLTSVQIQLVQDNISHATEDVWLFGAKFSEIIGKSAFPAWESSVLEFADKYLDFYVFDFQQNETSPAVQGIARAGVEEPLGLGIEIEVFEGKPRVTHKRSFLTNDRGTKAHNLLRFFDFHCGPTIPFWLPLSGRLFNLVNISDTFADIVSPSEDINYVKTLLKYLYLKLKDGSVVIVPIGDFTDQGNDVWRIVFVGTIDPGITVSSVKRATSAHFVRFDEAGYTENWKTTTVLKVDFSMIDTGDETEIDIDTPDARIGLRDPNDVPNMFWWFSANVNTWGKTATLAGSGDRGLRDRAAIVGDAGVQGPDVVTTWDMAHIVPPGFPVMLPELDGASADKWAKLSLAPANRPDRVVSSDFRSSFTVTTFDLSDADAPFWSNSKGMTLFFQFQMPNINPAFLKYAYLISRPGVVVIDSNVRVFDSSAVEHTITLPVSPGLQTNSTILAVRWHPGVSLKAWYNGGPGATTAPTTPSNISSGAGPTKVFKAGAIGSPPTFAQCANYGAAISYIRAISLDEMNFVGNYLAARYSGSWTNLENFS